MIHSPPKIVALSSNFDEHLVQVPPPLRASSHRLRTRLSDLVCEVSAEPIDPETDALVANVDPTLVQEVFDIAQRQRESDIHHHAKLDDLRRGFKVAERVLGHFPRLSTRIGHLKSGSSDYTVLPSDSFEFDLSGQSQSRAVSQASASSETWPSRISSRARAVDTCFMRSSLSNARSAGE